MTIDPARASRPGPYLYQPTTSTLGGTAKSPVRSSTPTGFTVGFTPSFAMRSRAGGTVAPADGGVPANVGTPLPDGDGAGEASAAALDAPTVGAGCCVQAVTTAATNRMAPMAVASQAARRARRAP